MVRTTAGNEDFYQLNQVRMTAHAAAVADEAAGALDTAASAAAPATLAGNLAVPILMKRDDFDFTILGLSEGGNRGATRAASVGISAHFKTATAAEAAHSSGTRAEASFCKQLQARYTTSTCLPLEAVDIMLASTEMAPLLMRIEA